VSARTPDVHDWVHVCARRCVRSTACVCVRTYARMRRMHPSVGVCVGVCVLSGGRRKGAIFHLGSTVHIEIIICTRARMYAGMRALVECISACVRGRARARAAGARASTNCVSLRTFYIEVY
jgi:hypothetical protein